MAGGCRLPPRAWTILGRASSSLCIVLRGELLGSVTVLTCGGVESLQTPKATLHQALDAFFFVEEAPVWRIRAVKLGKWLIKC